MEFDLRIKESSDTPVFREMQEQDLLLFLQAGFISFDEYLEASSKPYVDKILQKRQARQAEMEDAQQAGIPDEVVTEAALGSEAPADPMQALPVGLE